MPKKHRNPQRAAGANSHLRPKRQRVVRMYPVYRYKALDAEMVLGEKPLYVISRETRDEWMEQGAVFSISRGTAVRLKRNPPVEPQTSITMGPALMEGVVDRRAYALACLAGWCPRDRVAA